MIEAALLEQGHPLIRHATLPAEKFRDLTGFEHCLRLAAQAYANAKNLTPGTAPKGRLAVRIADLRQPRGERLRRAVSGRTLNPERTAGLTAKRRR
jgi:hypothetical protein